MKAISRKLKGKHKPQDSENASEKNKMTKSQSWSVQNTPNRLEVPPSLSQRRKSSPKLFTKKTVQQNVSYSGSEDSKR